MLAIQITLTALAVWTLTGYLFRELPISDRWIIWILDKLQIFAAGGVWGGTILSLVYLWGYR